MSNPTIAIIGAGLSGLVCARILQLHGVPVTVYELDSSADARQQGGSLDIHRDTGQVALEEAGLHNAFLKHTHQGGEATRVLDKTAHVFVDQPEPEGGNGRPEIDRHVLRRLFVESLDAGTIIWNAKLASVSDAGSGHTLRFADGRTAYADLVIGADGAWSKVRAALSATRPEYSGITLVEIRLADPAANHPDALATVGNGILFALSDNKYIGGHGGDEIALGLGMRVAEDWIIASGIDWADPVAVREALLQAYADWAPPLTDLIRQSDDDIWARPIYALPIGYSWPQHSSITLAGDAAHVMSPFAGEGANLAMIDGADLARAILSHDDLQQSIVKYEKRMLSRSKKSAKDSQNGLDRMFNAESPRKIATFYRRIIFLTRLVQPVQRVVARLS